MINLRTGIPVVISALIAVFFIGSCASPGPTGSSRAAKKSVANIKGGLEAYREEHGRWPTSVAVLQNYATRRGRSIDTSPFTKLRISRRSAATVLVEFTTLPPNSQSGGFALSKIDVK